MRWFPACRHFFCRPHRLLPRCLREDFAQVRRQLLPSPGPYHADQIASEVNLAPLPARALKMPVYRCLQPLMGIARHQLHAAQPSHFEITEKTMIGRRALGISDIDRQYLPMAVRSNTRDDEDALTDDLPALPDVFVAGINAQIRIRGLRQGAGPPCIQLRVQLPCQLGDQTLRETCPTKDFGNLADFAGRDAFDIHFHQRKDEGFLVSLVSSEQLCRERPVPILRHLQGERADAGVQLPWLVAVAIPRARCAAFV